ncbi:hypothetical protein GLOIN_2v1482909 [Rhizophagus irregularis DAOM 181602=DAOM 197198]|nr:hypothetical protein GLOIN_2v1482909 [Rhizophagus irregularis DAOM 181602=DAOM 197198]
MSENRRRTIGRPKSSWIWEFFNSEIRDGDKWVICKLDKIGTYNLKEMALTISHVRYPYTAENINDAIEEILEKWDLRSKVYSITTDNGRLIPVKQSISRVKRLINFFSRSKQSERLEDIQKSINESIDVLEQFAEATDYLGGSIYCTYSIMNLFIEKIKEDLLNPFLSSLSLSSIQSSPQSFSQSALQEIQETDEDVFIEKNIEIETNLNQPVNMSGLLKMVRTKLYENLCKYWNFQDSNALLASLLDPRTKNLKHVPTQIKIKTEDLQTPAKRMAYFLNFLAIQRSD